MNKDIFLLLGGNKLNYGITKKFKNLGYKIFLVDWNEKAQFNCDKYYQIDVKNAEGIISALKTDGYWKDVGFVYSSIDLATFSVATIGRELGFYTISDEGLLNSSSKSIMTQVWKSNGLLNRMSTSFQEFDNVIIFYNFLFKIIIKPDNSASSRGITIVPMGSPKEFILEAFYNAQQEATNRVVVVEEFVVGTEFTVDMIGDNYGNVSVYGISKKTHTEHINHNKVAVKLHYNSVGIELQETIAEYGIKCFKAVGFSNSMGHLEILLKEDGTLSPIEIGARSSGYIASDLLDIVSGSSYLEDVIHIQKGGKTNNGLHSQSEKSSLYFFYDFPIDSEIVNEVSLLDFCDSIIISRFSDRSNIIKGKKFSLISDDNSRLGFEILEGPKEIMTNDYIANAEKHMLGVMFGGNDDL